MKTMTLAEALLKFNPHRGLSGSSLIDKLASAAPGADPWSLDLTQEEREILGRILAEDDQCPSAAEVESAVATLTAKHLQAHGRTVTQAIADAEASGDSQTVADLLVLKKLVRRALDGVEE